MEWSQKILRYLRNAIGLAGPESGESRYQEDALSSIATLDAIAERERRSLIEKEPVEEMASRQRGLVIENCTFINHDRSGFVFDTLDPPPGGPGEGASPKASLREFLGRDPVQGLRGETVVAMKSPIKVLVCGGRAYNNQNMVFSTLDRVVRLYRPIAMIIHGDAMTELPDGLVCGADYFAAKWAVSRNIRCQSFPVTKKEWREIGRRAGPIRNQRMIDKASPDLVVAFPGGRGTADMITRARRAGIPVFDVGHIWEGPDGRRV